MEILKGLTVCHACKNVFNGIATELKCPECQSAKLLMMANSAVYEAAIDSTKDGCEDPCPNLLSDDTCEITGRNVWEDQ